MSKILFIIPSFIIVMLVSACSKTPFHESSISNNSSTVYVYVQTQESVNENMYDPCYKIAINDELLKECVEIDEFIELKNLQPQFVDVTAIREDIDRKKLVLNLEASKTYFLKIQSHSQLIGQYDFENVTRDVALKSISTMSMANPPKKEDDGILNFLVQSDKAPQEVSNLTTTPASKIDEITKANEMREKGIISDEEFNKLKAEILAK